MSDAVLLTGASGFIGRHLVDELLASADGPLLVGQGIEVVHPRVRSLPGRLAELPALIADQRFACVFHLAAYTPKSARDEDPNAAIAANVVGLEQLLDAVAGRTSRFVFASTLDVYGTPTGVLDETSPLWPSNVYAASKILGERLVSSWGRRHAVHTGIVRVGHIYGPGESAYQKLIPLTIQALLRGKPAVRFGAGDELRDLLYVGDAAKMIAAAQSRLHDADFAPVNLVAGESYRVADILDHLRALVGTELPLEVRPPVGEPRSFRFDATRVRALLPLPSYTPLVEGLRREVEWFRARA